MTLITAEEYDPHCAHCRAGTDHTHEQHKDSVLYALWNIAWMSDHLGGRK